MSSYAYALKRIFTRDDDDYEVKKKPINFDNEIEDTEEKDLLYRKYINMLEQQDVREHRKTNVGIEQVIEEMERGRKRLNVKNKVRLSFIKSSSLCSVLAFAIVFIYCLAVLGKINLSPIYVIIWMPVGFGAWLTNYINYEIWKSNNGEL